MSLPQKEAVVVIVDVGATMTGGRGGNQKFFQEAMRAVALLIQQKIMFSPKDEIGLVLFGTKETRNDLAIEPHYQHVVTARTIDSPDIELLRVVTEYTTDIGGSSGDFVDGLIVGMDLLVRRTAKKRYARRVFLVTDGGCPVSKQSLDIVLQQFIKIEARLNVIGIDFQDDEIDTSQAEKDRQTKKSAVKIRNESLLREIAEKVDGVVVSVHRAIDMMSELRRRSVLQRTTFRGRFEISPLLSIGVWSFLKSSEQSFPSLKRYSTIAPPSNDPIEVAVSLSRTYHSLVDPDVEVPSIDAAKGYKYGRSMVPFSSTDQSLLKFQSERCLQLIGFTPASSVPQYHYMSNTEMLVADPNDNHAGVAFSALCHALAETDRVAILRYVKTKNAAPRLAIASPHIKEEVESMWVHQLPFAEDLRHFTFPPLNKLHPSTKKDAIPTDEQLTAVGNLIDILNLCDFVDEDGEQTESLKPKNTFNPALQRFYQGVQHRALHPNTLIPPLDDTVLSYVQPDTELFTKAEPELATLQKHFKLEKSQAAQTAEKRKYWNDSVNDESRDIKLDSYVGERSDKKRKLSGEFSDSEFSVAKLISAGTTAVGSVNPVKDFMEMITRRDLDLVDKAVSQMKDRILQLVNDSIRDQYYQKAKECLIELRRGCVQEDEPTSFNEFLQDLRIRYEGREKPREQFWKMVVEEGMTLISEEESVESTVSAEEAAQFLSKPLVTSVPPVVEPSIHDESADDLFAMIE